MAASQSTKDHRRADRASPRAGGRGPARALGAPPPVAADCCTAADCTCDGSATDEAGCPSCVKGSVLNSLTTGTGTNYLPTQQDRDTFNTLWSNGDWAGLKQFLDSQGVPSPVGDMLMGQIAVAQKFEQYKNDALSGAGTGQLAYDLGQFNARVQEYKDKAQAAGNQNLINPTDFASRLQTMGDLSKKMDVINQFANVRDQATQPWSPDPSGGLTLSEGPIMILNDPDLPDGTMTQLSPDLVAIGTGGQGEFQVQVGNPSDVGYPLITNVPPVPEASTAAVQRTNDQALVINPATTGATFNFVIDQTPYTLKAGQSQPLAGRPSWVIAFDRGGQFGQARYTLAPGHYECAVTASGWDLVPKTYKVILDNSAYPSDFNFVLEGQAGMVPAHQRQEITSKLPVVLMFDRGNGRAVAHRELVEGTFTIGIDPQTKLLDLFPGPAPRSLTTALASAVPSAPTTTAAPTPPSPSPSTTDLP